MSNTTESAPPPPGPTTHGIFSHTPVIPGVETADEWHLHLASVLSDLHPVGHVEHALADQVAHILWRIKRLVRHETTVATHAHTTTGSTTPVPADLDRVTRYETHLNRQLQSSLDRLELLRRRRTASEPRSPHPGRPRYLYTPTLTPDDFDAPNSFGNP